MAITAAMVKELRERTGLGMMDCKAALTEAAPKILEPTFFMALTWSVGGTCDAAGRLKRPDRLLARPRLLLLDECVHSGVHETVFHELLRGHV